jgi:biotin transport system substrate-specific component
MSTPRTAAVAHAEAQGRVPSLALQTAVIVTASFFIALCARLTVPLPFTPVPLTLQNFGVLLVALALGGRRGFAALVLYLAEGAIGLPVFNPAGPGGIAQLLGPTGGYLMMYPLVAYVAGTLSERGSRTFLRTALSATAAELVLFAGGIGWLIVGWHQPPARALLLGGYFFFFAEVAKIMAAAALSDRLPRLSRN